MRALQLVYLSWNQTDRWRSKTHHMAAVELHHTALWRNPPSPQRINDLNALWSNPPAMSYYPAIWLEAAMASPLRNIVFCICCGAGNLARSRLSGGISEA